MHVADIIKHLIGNEADNFALWAFGDNYTSLNFNSCQPVDAWNNLHGDILKLCVSGDPKKDILKMIDLWKNIK